MQRGIKSSKCDCGPKQGSSDGRKNAECHELKGD